MYVFYIKDYIHYLLNEFKILFFIYNNDYNVYNIFFDKSMIDQKFKM